MTEKLQEFGFRDSSYERVEQPWQCGRLDEGPCPLGPGPRGSCGGRAGCRPLAHASAAGFRCARLKEHGGPCTEGPSAGGGCAIELTACRPVHSVRGRRTIVVRMSFAFTLGVLLLLLFGPARDDFVNPGALSDAHHRLGLDCAGCHGAAEGGAVDWLRWALDGNVDSDMANRCKQCHMLSDDQAPRNPHGLTDERLRELRAGQLGGEGAAADWMVPTMSCSACHQEHRGRERKLTATSDADCQGCHVRSFASFEKGHPEFPAAWPHEQRQPVAFDHKAHYGGLFAKGAGEAGPSLAAWGEPRCTICHEPDAAGRDMRPRFEQHCQVCHGGRMTYRGGSVDDMALRFVQFPWFDEGARPEGWSEEFGAMDPSEVSISVEMRILLGDDAGTYTRLMARVDEDERSPEAFLEMGEDAQADVTAFLTALKRMLTELAQADREQALAALARRFEASLGVKPTQAERELLWPAALQKRAGEALKAWFAEGEAGDDAGPARFRVDAENFCLDLTPIFQRRAPDRAHGDPTLQAWIPFILRRLERERPLVGADVARRIPAGIQRCLKCHNVDRAADGTLQVDWTGHEIRRRERLDRFVHAPHLGQDLAALRGAAPLPAWARLPALEGDPLMRNCLTCHVPTEHDAHDDFFLHFFQGAKDGVVPGRTKAHGARSNFSGISRALCATCHAPGQVRSDCLTCHVYHPGARATRAERPGVARGGGAPGR